MFYEKHKRTPFALSSEACFSDSPEQRSVSKGGSPQPPKFKEIPHKKSEHLRCKGKPQ
jgi:hypothetical protein